MTVEYRAWITVPGLPIADETAWEPVIAHLEEHTSFGPVLGWVEGVARFVLTTDAEDRATAADVLNHAVIEALRATGHGGIYPTAVEIEAADELEPARS